MAKEESKEKKAKTKRPSALKRDLQASKRRIRNRTFKSTMRSMIRKFEETVQKGDACSFERTDQMKFIASLTKALNTESSSRTKRAVLKRA